MRGLHPLHSAMPPLQVAPTCNPDPSMHASPKSRAAGRSRACMLGSVAVVDRHGTLLYAAGDPVVR